MAEQDAVPGFPGLKVCVSEVKGRHLAVTRPYKSGELLLKQKPYASTLSEGQDRCDHCMQPSRAGQLQRCAKCKQARYCCREHQRQAWQTDHAKECKALCAVRPRVPPPTVRLAARALWRAQGEAAQGGAAGLSMHSGTGTSAASEGGSWRDVQGLVHHWDVLEDSQKMLYAQMAALARQLALSGMENAAQVEQDGTLPGVEETAGLLARLAANAHTICDEELRPVGSGLYPLASMANHACRPSAMQSFDGDTMQFRALRPLAPGNEVTIAYVELAATRQDRREALWEQYCFDINATLGGTNSAQNTDRPAASESTQPGVAHNAEQCIPGGGSTQETGTSNSLYKAGGAPAGVCCNSGRSAHEGHEQLGGKQTPPAKQACKRITLLPPPLAELKLDLGPPGVGAHQSSQLQARVYSLHSHPPWPCDPNDGALTQLLLVQQQGTLPSKVGGNTAASSSSSNSSGNDNGGSGVVSGSKALPGGVQVHSLQVQPEEDPADSFGGFGGAGDEEAEGAPSTEAWKQQLQRQQRQQGHHRRKCHVVQVDMWGPWAEASLASVPSSLQNRPSATGGLPSLSAVPLSQTPAQTPAMPAVPLSQTPAMPAVPLSQTPAMSAVPLSQTPAQTPAMPGQGEIAQGGPPEQQLHALSVAVQQQQREAGSSAPNNASACPPYPCTCPMPQQQLQQQQQQLDVLSLAAEVGALEALVVHAETLMTHAEGGGHAQAVMLLLQGLARADGIAVRSVTPPASPCVGGGAPPPPPPPAMSTTATVSKSQKVMVALGPLHGLRIRLAATLMRAAVEGSSWKIALQAARMLTPLYEQLYPPVWPNLGLHFAQHAKLAMFLEHPAEAAQLADRAHRALTVTHFGQDICVEVARIRWEAQQESGEK